MFDPNQSQGQLETIRVLLVANESADTEGVRALLRSAPGPGFEVVDATSVERALSMLHEEPVHVVLLDLVLHGESGDDAMLRARVAAESVPIIVMTPEDDDAQAVRALRFGAQDYVVKGQAETYLLRAIRNAVERHRMLSEVEISRQHEHYLATHDHLTGLPNRAAFTEQLSRSVAYALRYRKRIAVLFMDLDRFKLVNDSLGHHVGDELLKQVSERLERCTRASDSVGRLGGDEFIMLAQDALGDRAPERVAENVLQELSRPFLLGGRQYWLSTSIGIAVAPDDGTDVDALMRHADSAMYQAKARGTNLFHHWAEGRNEAMASRLDLESALAHAIERDELFLVYQPQIDVAAARVRGVEALLRWRHPRDGVLPPSQFMGAAEETGLIGRIGEWVLQRMCRDAAAWPEQPGGDPVLALNVSHQQLASDEFTEQIAKALRDHSLSPGRLEIEVSELGVVKDRAVLVSSLAALRKLGVRIVIDDFGSGPSTVTVLKGLVVDGIKVDRSFVHGLHDDPVDSAIVNSLIAMGQGLGLRVVAAGVETREQLAALLEQGCHQMQGHLFSKPVTHEELVALLADPDAAWAHAIRD